MNPYEASSLLASLPGVSFDFARYNYAEAFLSEDGEFLWADAAAFFSYMPPMATGLMDWFTDLFDSSPPPLDAQTQAAISKADTLVDNKNCNKFLTDVINNLGLKNVTPQGLVTMLSQPELIVDKHHKSQRGAVVYEEGGRIYIAADGGYTSHLWASLLHEAFHLFKGVDNENLQKKMAKASVWGPDPYVENPITGYISANCRPDRGGSSGGSSGRGR